MSGYETLEDFEARAMQLKKTFDMCKVISEDPNDTAEVGTSRDMRHKYFNDLHPRFDPVVDAIKTKEIEYRQTSGTHGRHHSNEEIWQSLTDYQHTMQEKRPKVKAFHPPSNGMTRVTRSVANAATGVANVSVKDPPIGGGEKSADQETSKDDGGRGERKRSKRPCFAFRRTGKCKFGDKCRFSHNKEASNGSASQAESGRITDIKEIDYCKQHKLCFNCGEKTVFQKHMSHNCPHKNSDAKKNAWRKKLKELVNEEKNIVDKVAANTAEAKKVEAVTDEP